MGDNAWVTLATNDSYGLGALVLGQSLRQVGTRYQLAVLITPGVTEPMRDQLRSIFSVVTEVNVLDSRDEANLALLSRPELGVTFTKLHCWRLIQFSKCVFLDADTLVLQNCDELFDREELSAAPDAGWPDCFNSGVFVYRPSLDTFRSLIEFAVATGSFDGGDQGLLNLFFKDWATQDISRHLPFIYNMCSTATYSYLPAYKQFGSLVKIIHFIGPNKPWLLYFDTVTRRVRPPAGSEHLLPLLQIWWDIFCNKVHPSLTNDMTGLAGAFAKLTLGVPRSAEQIALEEHMRKQAWEQGNIDYLGADSFDNIWKKICETLASGPSENKARQKSPSPLPSTETLDSTQVLEPSSESSQQLEPELAVESEDTLSKAQKVVSTSAPVVVGSVSSIFEHVDTTLADSHKLSQSSKLESSAPSDIQTITEAISESNITHTSSVLVPHTLTLDDSTKLASSVQELLNITSSAEQTSAQEIEQNVSESENASHVSVSEKIFLSESSVHEKQKESSTEALSVPLAAAQEIPTLSDPLQVASPSVSVDTTVLPASTQTVAVPTTTLQTIPIPLASVQATPAPTAPIQDKCAPTASIHATSAPLASIQAIPTPSSPVQSTPAQLAPVPAARVQETCAQSVPAQSTYVESVHPSAVPAEPVRPAPVPAKPVQSTSIQEIPVLSAPIQAIPAPSIPVQAAPIPSAPVQGTSVPVAPSQTAAPVPSAPVHVAPLPSSPVQLEPAPSPVQPAPTPSPVQAAPVPSPVQPAPVHAAPVQASSAPVSSLHKDSKKTSSDVQKASRSSDLDISSKKTDAVTQKEVKSIQSLPEQKKPSDTAQGTSTPVSLSTQDSTKPSLSEQAPIPPKRKGGSKAAGGVSKESVTSKQGKPGSKGKK